MQTLIFGFLRPNFNFEGSYSYMIFFLNQKFEILSINILVKKKIQTLTPGLYVIPPLQVDMSCLTCGLSYCHMRYIEASKSSNNILIKVQPSSTIGGGCSTSGGGGGSTSGSGSSTSGGSGFNSGGGY
jgi:uncharacterized membrane protein YgcG